MFGAATSPVGVGVKLELKVASLPYVVSVHCVPARSGSRVSRGSRRPTTLCQSTTRLSSARKGRTLGRRLLDCR